MKTVKHAQFLEAGPKLAEKFALSKITPSTIARCAGLPKKDFLAEFDGVDAYLVELHHHFLEHILANIVKQAGSLPPGLERMAQASITQLDICLAQRKLRALLVEARRMVPPVAEAFHRRNQVTAMMIGIELKSIGCTQANIIGRLYCMMVLEAAQIEADAAMTVPVARQALADFLSQYVLVSSKQKPKLLN